jgi:predicted RNase H-like nuclease (RuvC/YqgF family)
MEKKKIISKSRFVKSKPDPTKSTIDQVSSDSLLKNPKLPQDSLKKSITPAPSRIKSKSILNKRTSDTPKLKIEDMEIKRKSNPNTQEGIESYYSSYIKTLTSKLEKHKTRSQDLEEEIKRMEMTFRQEEIIMKKEIEKLNFELKKIRNEKIEQENGLMEENFKLRRDLEDFKNYVSGFLNDISVLLQETNEKNLYDVNFAVSEISKKVLGMSAVIQDALGVRTSLKNTASFNNATGEIASPRMELQNSFKEAIVLHPHEPKSSEEIQLNVGDRVVVYNSDELSPWWIGKIKESIGKFPRNCVMLD